MNFYIEDMCFFT